VVVVMTGNLPFRNYGRVCVNYIGVRT